MLRAAVVLLMLSGCTGARVHYVDDSQESAKEKGWYCAPDEEADPEKDLKCMDAERFLLWVMTQQQRQM
jgi:hypothetical protein